MAIDWSLFDPSYGAKLGAALDPALIQERQNKLADLAQERQYRTMQMQQAVEAQKAKRDAEARRLAGIEEYARTGTAEVPLDYNSEEVRAQVASVPDEAGRAQLESALTQSGFGVPQQRALTPEEEYLRLQKLAMVAPDEARVPLSMYEFREKQKEARQKQILDIENKRQMQEERLAAQAEARRDRQAMVAAARGAGGGVDYGKLQPGYQRVRDARTGEVRDMPIPGSAPDIKLRGQHAQDYSAVTNASENADKLIARAEKLAKHSGLSGNFGLRGYAPNVRGSDAANAAVLLEELKDSMQLAGFQELRSSAGSPGAMTEKEWPKLEAAVAKLQNASDVETARAALADIATYGRRIKNVAQTAYQNEWGGTPYSSGNGGSDVDALLNKYK